MDHFCFHSRVVVCLFAQLFVLYVTYRRCVMWRFGCAPRRKDYWRRTSTLRRRVSPFCYALLARNAAPRFAARCAAVRCSPRRPACRRKYWAADYPRRPKSWLVRPSPCTRRFAAPAPRPPGSAAWPAHSSAPPNPPDAARCAVDFPAARGELWRCAVGEDLVTAARMKRKNIKNMLKKDRRGFWPVLSFLNLMGDGCDESNWYFDFFFILLWISRLSGSTNWDVVMTVSVPIIWIILKKKPINQSANQPIIFDYFENNQSTNQLIFWFFWK